jgi:hypothetical protein
MKSKLCMFCAQAIDAGNLSSEHFVPKGLWEEGYRPQGMKTLPAHKSCNAAFSKDNEYFRDVFAIEAGADRDPAAQRVQQGSLRRKMLKRPGSITKTLRNAGPKPVRTRTGIYLGQQPGFEVDRERIARVLFNVMKGIFYVSQGTPMPQEFISSVWDVNDLPEHVVQHAAGFMVPWQSFGDSAFRCRYVVSSQRPIEKMTCLLQFYQNRIFLGEAVAPSLVGANKELFVNANTNTKILVPYWAGER